MGHSARWSRAFSAGSAAKYPPNDIASTPSGEAADINDYPQQVMNSPAARWISGVAFHCYYGDPSAMAAFHNEYLEIGSPPQLVQHRDQLEPRPQSRQRAARRRVRYLHRNRGHRAR